MLFSTFNCFCASPRLRCDVVSGNLVACAYTTGKIEDSIRWNSSWRSVVHVKDVCKAFIAGLEAPTSMLGGRAFNVEFQMVILQ